jgi:putative Holliday junction resolvase
MDDAKEVGPTNQSPTEHSGRILGIDLGERRIGVALSDPDGILATGITTIDARNWDSLIKSLLDIVEREGVRTVVVGNPLTLKGDKGSLASMVQQLDDEFSARGLKVILWDERFSSKAARRSLIQQGVKTGHHKDDVNRKAAEWILQAYLDSKT